MNPYTNYGAGLAQTPSAPPSVRLPVNRGLLSWLLLSMVTFGIYPIVALANISSEVNLVASNRDRLHTTNGVLVFLLAFPTLGIYPFVWWHKISDRIGGELRARGIDYSFDAGSFWLWGVFGSLFCGLGSLVFIHKFTTAMNRLNEHYNAHGTSYPVSAVPGPFPAASAFPASSAAALPSAGFAGSSAALPSAGFGVSSATPILPVSSSAAAGPVGSPRMAAILLTPGIVLGIAMGVWWLVEWGSACRFYPSDDFRTICLIDGINYVSLLLFLVGVFVLTASRFARSKPAAWLWVFSGVGLFAYLLIPYGLSWLPSRVAEILSMSPISFSLLFLIARIFLAVGVFSAGVLLLARKWTGAMVALLVMAAALFAILLPDAYNLINAVLANRDILGQVRFYRWSLAFLSDILIIAGLVVLALAVKKADWADRGDAA